MLNFLNNKDKKNIEIAIAGMMALFTLTNIGILIWQTVISNKLSQMEENRYVIEAKEEKVKIMTSRKELKIIIDKILENTALLNKNQRRYSKNNKTELIKKISESLYAGLDNYLIVSDDRILIMWLDAIRQISLYENYNLSDIFLPSDFYNNLAGNNFFSASGSIFLSNIDWGPINASGSIFLSNIDSSTIASSSIFYSSSTLLDLSSISSDDITGYLIPPSLTPLEIMITDINFIYREIQIDTEEMYDRLRDELND